VVALLVAAATAPPLLLLFFLLLGSWSKPSWPGPDTLLVGLPIIFMFGVSFGIVGSVVFLAPAFGLLDYFVKRLGRARRRWYVLAGAAAGAMHLALAYLSLHGPWLRGLGFWLGTWVAAGALEKEPIQICLAAPLAGAAAGLVYACIRFPLNDGPTE
jgi:hypothetical protein